MMLLLIDTMGHVHQLLHRQLVVNRYVVYRLAFGDSISLMLYSLDIPLLSSFRRLGLLPQEGDCNITMSSICGFVKLLCRCRDDSVWDNSQPHVLHL